MHSEFCCIYGDRYYNTIMKANSDAKKTVNTVIRIPSELHEKLRLMAYKERRSQHSIIMEIMEKALRAVQVPQEDKK